VADQAGVPGADNDRGVRNPDAARKLIEAAVRLSGGWREAIGELEDWCHEGVRLKNMVAAIDQLDAWVVLAKDFLKEDG
jgi:hypothetical protein